MLKLGHARHCSCCHKAHAAPHHPDVYAPGQLNYSLQSSALACGNSPRLQRLAVRLTCLQLRALARCNLLPIPCHAQLQNSCGAVSSSARTMLSSAASDVSDDCLYCMLSCKSWCACRISSACCFSRVTSLASCSHSSCDQQGAFVLAACRIIVTQPWRVCIILVGMW